MATVNTNELFAENLIQFRKQRGWSQEKLAEEINISRQTIIKYEKGEVNPSIEILFRISDSLSIPVDYFLKKNSEFEQFSTGLSILDVSLSDINYREKGALDKETDEVVKEQAFKDLEKLLTIERLTNSVVEFKNPIKNFSVKNKRDGERAAIELRKKWGLYENPIANVVSLLENKGIKVFEINISQKFQGLSARFGEVYIIVLNVSVEEVTRRRFTALHELAHLVLSVEDNLSYDVIEKICDAFAATMLLPKELLIAELGACRTKLNRDELKKIKEKYGISIVAILVGAAFSEIITWDLYRQYYEENKQSVDSANYCIEEKASRFEQLLFRGIMENKIDRDTAVALSGMSMDKIKNIEQNY